MTVRLESGPLAVTIDPEHGARLSSFTVHGHEVLVAEPEQDPDAAITWGSFPMVPWAGRIGHGRLRHPGGDADLPVSSDGHALHGLGLERAWTQVGPTRFELAVGAPWPVEGTAVVEYSLDDTSLTCELSWDGDGPGASLGFHPWFRRELDDGSRVSLDVGLVQMLRRGPDGLPTGELVALASPPWDDCFVVDRQPVLTWGERFALRLEADTSWWVLFTERDHAVCAEPQTAPPDAWRIEPESDDLRRRSLHLTVHLVATDT